MPPRSRMSAKPRSTTSARRLNATWATPDSRRVRLLTTAGRAASSPCQREKPSRFGSAIRVFQGYRKIWARLRHAGIRTSARRVRRLMGQHGLLAPHRVGRPEQRAHDGTITTTVVDAMWGTDMTETVTIREGRARVFVAVDHCSGECVGNHAARSGNRFEALEPVRQGVLRHFGRIEKNAAKGLSLRHDHGSNYLSRDFQAEIGFLGLESSPSFVRQPEGNGVAERFIRTLKENFPHLIHADGQFASYSSLKGENFPVVARD